MTVALILLGTAIVLLGTSALKVVPRHTLGNKSQGMSHSMQREMESGEI